MKKNYLLKSGFTLMEMVIAVIIMGVIASVAYPRYMLSVERSRTFEAIHVLQAIAVAQNIHFLENGFYAVDIDDLDVEISSMENFVIHSINNDENQLAVLHREPGVYEVWIDKDLVITCAWTGDTDDICAKFGFEY